MSEKATIKILNDKKYILIKLFYTFVEKFNKMKKIVILSMFAFATLTTINVNAQSDLAIRTELSLNETAGTGKVLVVDDSKTMGVIVDNETGVSQEFINPSNLEVVVGEQYSFLRIIQSTPNGEKVIIILKTKMPL